ncbi:MAG: glycosyltransferase, partial [Phycisphaerales bacterium]|nr:glycosyltransferase [Phycisphaerales bacterium]
RVLDRVEGARLLLKGAAFGHDRARGRLTSVLGDRVEFLGRTPRFEDHLATYRRVHVALDPMPYNGTTTTCEALLMGVPVVTCPGQTHAARVGASLLEASGMVEGLASDEDDYVDRAVACLDLAMSGAGTRDERRARFESSSLRDEAGHASAVADALRHMWHLRLEQR